MPAYVTSSDLPFELSFPLEDPSSTAEAMASWASARAVSAMPVRGRDADEGVEASTFIVVNWAAVAEMFIRDQPPARLDMPEGSPEPMRLEAFVEEETGAIQLYWT